MKKFAKNILSAIVLVSVITSFGSARAAASDDKLKSIVDKYLVARQSTMLQASTSTDVDNLLAFYSEGVIYEHPRVKIRIEGKANIREGMIRFLGVTKDTRIIMVNRICGANVVAAEYRVTFKAKQGSSWEEVSRTQVTLFEFEGEKIKRVVDYW
jgi:ketosteroid isomerase-like protein